MPASKSITIIGGGLAGLTLGIALRQRDVPVTIHEAGRYPRHRVCGEFISGRGLKVLEQLGLAEKFRGAGARNAGTAGFYVTGAPGLEQRLPQPALCLSRFVMDALLAKEFRRLGGELREDSRGHERDLPEGFVRATGRRIQAVEDGWRWIGLKVHARRVELQAGLEMHFLEHGYIGLCQLHGEVNVCGLFRSRAALSDLAKTWPDLLRGAPGTSLRERMSQAEFAADSFCAVSGLGLAPRRAGRMRECAIGDALTMIPPVTGNGMSMAFESAEIAADPLAEFSRGELGWPCVRALISRRCDRRFALRLATAALLHKVLFHPRSRRTLAFLLRRTQWPWGLIFRQTR